jgi:hypothetical protein
MFGMNVPNIADEYPQCSGQLSPMLGTIFACCFLTVLIVEYE